MRSNNDQWLEGMVLVGLLSLSAHANELRPRIELHYGKLKTGEAEILDRSFIKAEWAEAQKRYPDFDFVGPYYSRASDLVRSANNSGTKAILWVGHPSTIHADQELKNVFLLDPMDRHLPKRLFTAGGGRVRWGVASCHTASIRKFYPSQSPLLLPQSLFEVDDPKRQSILELTSLYSAPQEVLSQVLNALGDEHSEVPATQIETYEIEVSDLMSTRFDYVVLRNGELIQILQSDADASKRGRRQKFSFTISVVESPGPVHLEILPDDSKRWRRKEDPEFIVDDILVHSVQRNGVEWLQNPVHLGDESRQVDQQTQSFRRDNLELLLKTPVQDSWGASAP